MDSSREAHLLTKRLIFIITDYRVSFLSLSSACYIGLLGSGCFSGNFVLFCFLTFQKGGGIVSHEYKHE